MTPEELQSVRHFSEAEIIATGGNIAGLSFLLFQRLDQIRDWTGPIKLLPGGLNSGQHISNVDVHAQGLAADWYYDNPLAPTFVFRAMIDAGLKGIGIYWNGAAYSFHGDVRPTERIVYWFGVKKSPAEDWQYLPLTLSDLRLLL